MRFTESRRCRRWFPALLIAVCGVATVPDAAAIDGRLKGTIRDQAGGLLPGVPVRLYAVEAGRKRVFVTHTDHQGRFRFDGLAAGSYEIEVGGERFAAQSKDSIVVRPPFRNVIDFSMLPGGGAPPGLHPVAPFSIGSPGRIGAPPGSAPGTATHGGPVGRQVGLVQPLGAVTGAVGGMLRDGKGNGVPDARIELRGAERSWRAVSSIDGTFRIDAVPAGQFLLEVHSPGYLSVRLPSVVVDGRADLDFRLTLIDFPLDFQEKIEEMLPPERPIPPNR